MTLVSLVPWLLAHQGGWDEVALVLTPILLFAALLWLADRRASALKAAHRAPSDDGSDDPAETSSDEPSPQPDDQHEPPG